jgi:hypothetical protein
VRAEYSLLLAVAFYLAAAANKQLPPFGTFQREARQNGNESSVLPRPWAVFFIFVCFFHNIYAPVTDIARAAGISIFMRMVV